MSSQKNKTFISVMPFQSKGMLEAVTYQPYRNDNLKYGETRFPIIPVINGYTEKGDNIRVIAIKTKGENYDYNYTTYFKPEVEALSKNKGLYLNEIEIIDTPDSEDIDTQLTLFSDIISTVGDNEDVYACITYGTKPTPIVLSMALNYLYRLKQDVSVSCIVYGRHSHNKNDDSRIYDTTSLFYMDSIVNKLAEAKANDPARAIRIMLGLETVEDN